MKDLLFRRYANPLNLLSTYTLEGLADFILQLFDKEAEDEIWQTWLHKEMKDNYGAFKKKYLKRMHKPVKKALSKEEEKQIIERNMQFIKPINKGGD